MIPHATPTSNSLHHHHLFVPPVLLHYTIFQFNQHRVLQPLLFDNSDLSNFLKFFACDLSPQHYQTKYSTLSDTGKMNHENKPENLPYFNLKYEAWVKISIN